MTRTSRAASVALPRGLARSLLTSVLAIATLSSAPVRAAPPLRLAVEAHASLLSNQVDRSFLNVTFGGGVRLGYREDGDAWGGFLFFEQNAWVATDLVAAVVPGVWNFGVGVERIWASEAIRTSMTVGTSTLAYDTDLDGKGQTGLYLDLRPAALRWHLSQAVVFEFTPLHFTVVAPVLKDPRLIAVEYRTTLALEFALR